MSAPTPPPPPPPTPAPTISSLFDSITISSSSSSNNNGNGNDNSNKSLDDLHKLDSMVSSLVSKNDGIDDVKDGDIRCVHGSNEFKFSPLASLAR